MTRALICLALLTLGGCESAAKHPAITIGTVSGTIGFGLCELSVSSTETCAIIGGTAALALGGITALVTWLANTNADDNDPALQGDDDQQNNGATTEAPPGLPAWMRTDAGVPVPDAPRADAAVGDAPLVDAM